MGRHILAPLPLEHALVSQSLHLLVFRLGPSFRVRALVRLVVVHRDGVHFLRAWLVQLR